MSEPFEGLRAYVGSTVRQPDFAVVRGRARRLRRRRTIITGAVTAVLLLLGLGYAVQAAPHRHDQPVHPVPSPSVPARGLEDSREQVVAGGPHDLYALLGSCFHCAEKLYASADDGATWQRRTLPPVPKGATDQNRAPTLVTLGPGLLAWTDDPPGQAGTLREYGWISADGGATWRRPQVGKTPVAAIAPGTAPIGCGYVGRPSPCLVYAIDPATGRFAPLATQPTGIVIAPRAFVQTAVPVDAGAVYVVGLDPATRKPAIASSTDRGRSWRIMVLAAGDRAKALHDPNLAAEAYPNVVAGAGGSAYAGVRHGTDTLSYRTTDDGRTWQLVAAVPACQFGYFTPDGGYVCAVGPLGPPFVISRHGGPFEPITIPALNPPSSRDSPRQLAAGLYVSTQPPSSLSLSHDGLNWREVDIG